MRKNLHLILALMMLLVASCTHKELCVSHPHTLIADVTFDWSNAPDASPESMSLYLFPVGQEKSLRYEFGSLEGGKIKINPGEYKAIFLNSDTRNIILENKDSFEEFLIKSEDATLHANPAYLSASSSNPPRARGTQDERVAASPECIWAGSAGTFVFDENNNTLHLEPMPAFISFNVDINNIENAEYAYAITGALSTLADGFLPGSGVLSDDLATVPFALNVKTKSQSAQGSFRSFGHCPRENMTHYLTIYTTLIDGTNTSFTYDVTDQIHNADNANNITITLNTLPLPEPEFPEGGEGGGGFVPSIKDWNTVEINISM